MSSLPEMPTEMIFKRFLTSLPRLKSVKSCPLSNLFSALVRCYGRLLSKEETELPDVGAQGDNLFQLLGTKLAGSTGAYMVLAALFMVPTVWLPDLKSLSYLGFAGITATFTVTSAVAYTLLTGARCEILFLPPVGHTQHVLEVNMLCLNGARAFGPMQHCVQIDKLGLDGGKSERRLLAQSSL